MHSIFIYSLIQLQHVCLDPVLRETHHATVSYALQVERHLELTVEGQTAQLTHVSHATVLVDRRLEHQSTVGVDRPDGLGRVNALSVGLVLHSTLLPPQTLPNT